MNADRAKASSFVRATSIPTALAARSLERTAMNIRPAGALRSRATSSPTRHTTTSAKIPKITRRYASPLAIPRSRPKSSGVGALRPAQPAAEALVVEQQRVDRERERERHHRQVDAADPQRRQPDQQPERDREQRREQEVDRERDARALAEAAELERAEAGERHLRQRHLADVAGQHDERQRQAHEHDRVDERRPQRALEQDQHDHADHEARRRRDVGPGRPPERRVVELADHTAGPDAARDSVIATMITRNGSASGRRAQAASPRPSTAW